jgi:hypothetical protein
MRLPLAVALICLAALSFLALGGCGSSKLRDLAASEPGITTPTVQDETRLPGLGGLPAGQGRSLSVVILPSYQLLDNAPVSTSGAASAVYSNGSITLKPAQAGGVAWAIFELFDFPKNGTIKADSVSTSGTGHYFAGISNYARKKWNHFEVTNSANITLGSAFKYHSDAGSMYVAVLADGANVTVNSLLVLVTEDLPNDGYDEREDNDSASAAQPLPALPLSGFLANLGPGGYDGDNEDNFSFTAMEKQTVTITLTYPEATANFTLTLNKSTGTLVTKYDQGNPGVRTLRIGLKAGSYVIKVARLTGTADYTLDAVFSDEGYTELEDNDTIGQANALPASLAAHGSVGADSYDGDTSDYYFFDAAEGDVATIALTYPSATSNVSLSLFNTAGTLLNKDSAGNSGSRSFNWGLHAGAAYVQVKAEAGAADYDLIVTLNTAGFDEVENNDSFLTAQPLPGFPVADFSGHAGAFGYDGDNNDYYSFNCADGDIVTVTLDYDETQGNLSMVLYNADQSSANSDSAGNPGMRSFAWGLRGGLCFVAVNAVNGNSNYTLDISKSSPGFDETENNDSQATADVIGSFPVVDFLGSLGAQGYDGDTTDFLTFTAADQELFTFTLDYDEANSNLGMTLLNGAGQQIYADTAGNPAMRSFTWGLKAGSCFLKLTGASGASNYTLNITKAQQSFSETEDNDTRPTAQQLPALPVANFTGHAGPFGYDGDNDDFFFVNIDTAVLFSSTMTYDSLTGTLRLTLQNSLGTTIDSDTAGNPGVRVVQAPLTPGTYYVVVQRNAGNSDYSLAASAL